MLLPETVAHAEFLTPRRIKPEPVSPKHKTFPGGKPKRRDRHADFQAAFRERESEQAEKRRQDIAQTTISLQDRLASAELAEKKEGKYAQAFPHPRRKLEPWMQHASRHFIQHPSALEPTHEIYQGEKALVPVAEEDVIIPTAQNPEVGSREFERAVAKAAYDAKLAEERQLSKVREEDVIIPTEKPVLPGTLEFERAVAKASAEERRLTIPQSPEQRKKQRRIKAITEHVLTPGYQAPP